MRIIVALLLVIQVVIGQEAFQEETVVYHGDQRHYYQGQASQIGEKHTIHVKDLITQETTVLFKGTRPIKDAKMSPDRKRVCAIQWLDSKRFGDTRLIILSASGELIFSADNNVRDFAWTNDGNRLVFITGIYLEMLRGYANPQTWVYDLVDESMQEIGIKASEMSHAEFDDCFYFKGTVPDGPPGVYSYNPRSEVLEATTYNDIYMSPSGRYYYSISGEKPVFTLYDRLTNADLGVLEIDDPGINNLLEISWLKPDLLLIWATGITTGDFTPFYSLIYDVQEKTVLNKAEGGPIGVFPLGTTTWLYFVRESVEINQEKSISIKAGQWK